MLAVTYAPIPIQHTVCAFVHPFLPSGHRCDTSLPHFIAWKSAADLEETTLQIKSHPLLAARTHVRVEEANLNTGGLRFCSKITITLKLSPII